MPTLILAIMVETPMNKGIQTIYDSMNSKTAQNFFLCEMNADS